MSFADRRTIGWRPMGPRSPVESHRASTPLELFFDLCFVVAIAQAGSSLHHALIDGHGRHALSVFPIVFFAIWWAWMNFTWFASAYDNDDVPYRLAVLVQIAGALILAAGVPRAFDDRDFAVVTVGYLVMRVALISLWLRAAIEHREGRGCSTRYAIGVGACQVGWLSLLLLPEHARPWGWLILVPLELLVPVWAERRGATSWHPGHIVERYGLFTIIVLGESVLAASVAIQTALDGGQSLADLASITGGGLLIVFSMWWIYFDLPAERVVSGARTDFSHAQRAAFIWGYGHLVVFASAAAVGAGLAATVDHTAGHADLTSTSAALSVTVPVSVYLASVWVLHVRFKDPGMVRTFAVPVAVAAILASSVLGESVLITGFVMAALIVVSTASRARAAKVRFSARDSLSG
ncbi:MAG: low temperature requirement protein A [Acidimicrobiales bacterium]